KNPFFVASYIPKHSKFGIAGMMDLVPQVREVWRTRRGELEKVGEDIKLRIEAFENRLPEEALGKDVLDDAYEKLAQRIDAEHGGFGGAPKFPSPHNLLFLLRYWNRTTEKNALMMVEKTLRFMRLGGLFDQVGLGFHRYSTDAEWLVPHFEKMLYDQALLALAYLEAYLATGAGKFKVTAKEVLEYVMIDLASPEGVFYSAEDADSEGEEGKFYLWTEQEIRGALTREDADLAVKLFAVETRGNFDEPGVGRSGKNILHLAKPLDDLASELQLTVEALIPRLGIIQKGLFKAREKRVHPAKDNKILTDWNGLMIAALARASQVFGEKKYLQAAVKAADFLLERMKDKNGTLNHRYIKGEKAVQGFLDDYAFLAFGLTEIYEASFDERFLQSALELTNAMIARFWDEKDGGFFFTAKGSADVVAKRKEIYDGALPSGNSMALLNLLRLARLSENTGYEEMGNRLSRTFSAEVKESPSAHTFLLLGIDFTVGPAYNVTLVGDLNEEKMLDMLKALRANYVPNMVVSLKPARKASLGYEQIDGKATAYVCRGQTCLPPTNSPMKMMELLGVPRAGC
ncbi:MAG TPA: thioredoxin domain-containing protein, partial [Candidatus Bathyarchaeia archaeon]|nr:thioredoxin domain-containing protein [Candidatus Bathyarchaeia archaeon]